MSPHLESQLPQDTEPLRAHHVHEVRRHWGLWTGFDSEPGALLLFSDTVARALVGVEPRLSEGIPHTVMSTGLQRGSSLAGEQDLRTSLPQRVRRAYS